MSAGEISIAVFLNLVALTFEHKIVGTRTIAAKRTFQHTAGTGREQPRSPLSIPRRRAPILFSQRTGLVVRPVAECIDGIITSQGLFLSFFLCFFFFSSSMWVVCTHTDVCAALPNPNNTHHEKETFVLAGRNEM